MNRVNKDFSSDKKIINCKTAIAIKNVEPSIDKERSLRICIF